jgi:hypothetical protein
MNKEEIKSVLESKTTNHAMKIVLIAACTIIVFHIGEEFGYRKAEIMNNMSGGYYKTFGAKDHRRTGPVGYLFDDQTNTHGVSGRIINITDDKLLVADEDGIEKTVVIKDKTIIKKLRADIKKSDVLIDDFIVVIGSPTSDGKIEAKIIRIMPPPPDDPRNKNSSSTKPFSY